MCLSDNYLREKLKVRNGKGDVERDGGIQVIFLYVCLVCSYFSSYFITLSHFSCRLWSHIVKRQWWQKGSQSVSSLSALH